jgi:Fe-S-cluster containining protein
MEFNCSGCGLCCTIIAKRAVEAARTQKGNGVRLTKLQTDLVNFPYGFKPDGACEMYEAGKGCKVYDNRPPVCSVSKSYRLYEKGNMKKKAYFALNAKKCNEMVRENQLDNKFLVTETY